MSALSWVSWSRSSVYSIQQEEDADDDDSGSFLMEEEGKGGQYSRAYSVREALVNRLIFLATASLVVIFFVCISGGGAISNMEWIREKIMQDYGSIMLGRSSIMAFSNSIRGGTQMVALVVATTKEGVAEGQVPSILGPLTADFQSMDLNRTAIVWVQDAKAEEGFTGRDLCMDGAWSVYVMSADNATTMEELVGFMVDRAEVGVVYLDAGSIRIEGGGLAMELLGPGIHKKAPEDIVFWSMEAAPSRRLGSAEAANATGPEGQPDGGEDTSTQEAGGQVQSGGGGTQQLTPLLDPPSIPLVDTSIMVAWSTIPTRNLFRDASSWVHLYGGAGATHHRVGVSSFAINMLCNSGRVVSPAAATEADEAPVDTLRFRMIQRDGLPGVTRVPPGGQGGGGVLECDLRDSGVCC